MRAVGADEIDGYVRMGACGHPFCVVVVARPAVDLETRRNVHGHQLLQEQLEGVRHAHVVDGVVRA